MSNFVSHDSQNLVCSFFRTLLVYFRTVGLSASAANGAIEIRLYYYYRHSCTLYGPPWRTYTELVLSVRLSCSKVPGFYLERSGRDNGSGGRSPPAGSKGRSSEPRWGLGAKHPEAVGSCSCNIMRLVSVDHFVYICYLYTLPQYAAGNICCTVTSRPGLYSPRRVWTKA